ncbi:MAG: hypothetical protein QXH07_02385 [Thermoplasmata archaeon]
MGGSEYRYKVRVEELVEEYTENPARHKYGLACDTCGFSDVRALFVKNHRIICYNCYHISKISQKPASIAHLSLKDIKKLDKQRS